MESCIINYVHRTFVNWLHSEEVGLENMKLKDAGIQSPNRAYLALVLHASAQIQHRAASDTASRYATSGPRYGTCINGSQDSFMQQGGGHEYGTGRTRKWDGTAGGVMKIWTG